MPWRILFPLLFPLLLFGESFGELRTLSELFFSQHYKYRSFSPTLTKQFIAHIVHTFDPNNRYLLEEEVTLLLQQERLAALQRDFNRGNFEQLHAVQELFKTALHRAQRLRCANSSVAGEETLQKKWALLLANNRYQKETYIEKKTKKEDRWRDPAFFQTVAMQSFVQCLDPYSSVRFPDIKEGIQQAFLEKWGLFLVEHHGEWYIEDVVAGSPASRAQLTVGSLLPKINYEKSQGLESVALGQLADRFDWLTLDYLPQEDGEVTRVRLEPPYWSNHTPAQLKLLKRQDDLTVGWLTLPSFYQSESRSVFKDVEKLLQQASRPIDTLVIDLRTNEGGYLTEAVRVAGLFIPTGNITMLQQRNSSPLMLRDSDPRCLFSGPLVLVTSCNSASSAEVFAGALQEMGRAVVVGDAKTYGKGLAQAVRSSHIGANAFAYKISVAHLTTPAGKAWDKQGISSDIILSRTKHVPQASVTKQTHKISLLAQQPTRSVHPIVEKLRQKSRTRTNGVLLEGAMLVQECVHIATDLWHLQKK